MPYPPAPGGLLSLPLTSPLAGPQAGPLSSVPPFGYPPHTSPLPAPAMQPLHHSLQSPPQHHPPPPRPPPQQQPHLSLPPPAQPPPAFAYAGGHAPFLPPGGSAHSPHPPPPLFGSPYRLPPPAQSGQYGFNLPPALFAHSGNAAGGAGQSAGGGGGGAGVQQSLITAQGSSFSFSSPNSAPVAAAQRSQPNDLASYARSPSPLRPPHLSGQPLNPLMSPPPHPHALFGGGLSLSSPSLLVSHSAAAAPQPHPLYSHLPFPPPLALQPYLNPHAPPPQHSQHLPTQQQATGQHFFPAQHSALPAPYQSLTPAPPSQGPNTRWHCPGGCGKVLNKRSFRSLKKHKSICVLYMGWASKHHTAAKRATGTATAAAQHDSAKKAEGGRSAQQHGSEEEERDEDADEEEEEQQEAVQSEPLRFAGRTAEVEAGVGSGRNGDESSHKRQRTAEQPSKPHAASADVSGATGSDASSLASSAASSAVSSVPASPDLLASSAPPQHTAPPPNASTHSSPSPTLLA